MIVAGEKKKNPVWGCVLIGGKSVRMGQAKHLIDAGGVTWVEKAVGILLEEVDRIVISGKGELPPSLAHCARVADVPGLFGPLAGILATLRRWPGVSWLVVACDMPEISQEALRWLLSHQGPEVHGVLPDLNGTGQVEPLLAYYDHQCLPEVEAIAAGGSKGIYRLKESKHIITPQPPPELRHCWRNINSPQELAVHRNSIHR